MKLERDNAQTEVLDLTARLGDTQEKFEQLKAKEKERKAATKTAISNMEKQLEALMLEQEAAKSRPCDKCAQVEGTRSLRLSAVVVPSPSLSHLILCCTYL